jgi:predicted nuclease of predicted toxin-antitoxin system
VRFRIDADLPRSIRALLKKRGHEGIDVRDVGLRNAKDPVVATYAQGHGLCLLTGDPFRLSTAAAVRAPDPGNGGCPC